MAVRVPTASEQLASCRQCAAEESTLGTSAGLESRSRRFPVSNSHEKKRLTNKRFKPRLRLVLPYAYQGICSNIESVLQGALADTHRSVERALLYQAFKEITIVWQSASIVVRLA